MRQVNIIRESTDEQGTFGRIHIMDIGWSAYTLEPPWRNNEPNKSCIPTGAYECVWRKSPKYGWCYHVQNVPNRSHILSHPGNLGGDQEAGYVTHTLGCILQGLRIGSLTVNGRVQKAVLVSRAAIREFNEHMRTETFQLNVVEAYEGVS